MLAMGWNLERISLGSLIIALGLLVDDSIIAIEMMVVKMEGGLGPRQGGRLLLLRHRDAAPDRRADHRRRLPAHRPVPSPRTGEYAGGIFWIVGAAVVFSWVCLRHLHALPRGQDAAEGLRQAPPWRRPVRHPASIASCAAHRLRHREALAGDRRDRRRAGARLRRHEVRAAAVLPEQLAPRTDRRPAHEGRLRRSRPRPSRSRGWKRCSTKDEDVRFFTAYTGAGAPRFYLALSPELPNPGYAQFVVMTKDLEAREHVRSRLMALADEQFPQARVRVTRLELGPPVGYPGAVPRGRPRHAEGARDRPRRGTRDGGEPQGARRAARLERPGPHAQDRPRPGQGACPRPRPRGSRHRRRRR